MASQINSSDSDPAVDLAMSSALSQLQLAQVDKQHQSEDAMAPEISAPSTSTAFQEFHFFYRLPKEIRDMIWKEVLSQPQAIYISHTWRIHIKSEFKGIGYVNKDTYSMFKNLQTKLGGLLMKPIYYNPKIDCLSMNTCMLWRLDMIVNGDESWKKDVRLLAMPVSYIVPWCGIDKSANLLDGFCNLDCLTLLLDTADQDGCSAWEKASQRTWERKRKEAGIQRKPTEIRRISEEEMYNEGLFREFTRKS